MNSNSADSGNSGSGWIPSAPYSHASASIPSTSHHPATDQQKRAQLAPSHQRQFDQWFYNHHHHQKQQQQQQQ
eukprot:CAMPEP_0185273944 /NCGR_PEP_ID=MMETSP1359-20130426/50668_1 /TAXON_ID=552665 /ORGANISM="Bigelowiella longifila, Strain CCMP242" /LENGTH=72 /DNA_ID=CAMNT_0027866737 /DNA_START=87 /DNA_END=302 /DNA_ORIENTATION=+